MPFMRTSRRCSKTHLIDARISLYQTFKCGGVSASGYLTAERADEGSATGMRPRSVRAATRARVRIL
jgi:hypothetical protein